MSAADWTIAIVGVIAFVVAYDLLTHRGGR